MCYYRAILHQRLLCALALAAAELAKLAGQEKVALYSTSDSELSSLSKLKHVYYASSSIERQDLVFRKLDTRQSKGHPFSLEKSPPTSGS